jgi:hypothetical protein
VAQFGRALRSGRRGRGFESRRFDEIRHREYIPCISGVFLFSELFYSAKEFFMPHAAARTYLIIPGFRRIRQKCFPGFGEAGRRVSCLPRSKKAAASAAAFLHFLYDQAVLFFFCRILLLQHLIILVQNQGLYPVPGN